MSTDYSSHGGSWNDVAENCRSAYRSRNDPGDRDSHLGFRIIEEA